MDDDEGSKSRGVEEGMSVFALGGRLLFVCALGEDVLRWAVHRRREKGGRAKLGRASVKMESGCAQLGRAGVKMESGRVHFPSLPVPC